ncbi:hypothetical protein Z043_117747, partial [Scleropages formosus]
YSLEDSDLEGLSDITVSSVHTSDLSSFEEESDEEPQLSDTTEEGEITSEDEKIEDKKAASDNAENRERKPRMGRQAYVHKPFLYSRYYSDSDDEVTVEQRRRNAAKDKEERLLKRQQNRERLEEKRRQKASQQEDNAERKETASASSEFQGPSCKEARKEKKVLEKMVAISRKRKKHSRRISESTISEESQRRKSIGDSPATVSNEPRDPKKLSDRSKTHSFILDLEQGSEELLRHRAGSKFDRIPRKEQGEAPKHVKERERVEKERSLSDERGKSKQKTEKIAGVSRTNSEASADENWQKDGTLMAKVAAEEKTEKKSKTKDRRISSLGKEGGAQEEGSQKDSTKKMKVPSSSDALKMERVKVEKAPLVKSDAKLPFSLDSTGSSEDKSDIEPGCESGKKKDRYPKEMIKRSKSYSEEKHVDKPRSKLETKDVKPGEKDAERKPKPDHAVTEHVKPEKPSSDTDLDRKSRDVECGSKVKAAAVDKSRSKSREDSKMQAGSKVEKKTIFHENKSKATKPVSRPNLAKERKKEEGVKEDSKTFEENLHDKVKAGKDSKRLSEKLSKDIETVVMTQSERKKGSRSEELSPGSSLSPSAQEILEPVSKKLDSEEDRIDSETVRATGHVTIMDDTLDALSDITPEPEDEETSRQVDEDLAFRAALEANRPLSPLEGASSNDMVNQGGKCVPGLVQREEVQEAPLVVSNVDTMSPNSEVEQKFPSVTSLQEADLKRQEAALTLLSMDPDMTVVQNVAVIRQFFPVEAVLPESELQTSSPSEALGDLVPKVEDRSITAVQPMDVQSSEPSCGIFKDGQSGFQ